MPAASFGSLFDQTFRLLRERAKPLLAGAVVFAALFGVTMATAGMQALSTSQPTIAQDIFGLSGEELVTFQERIQSGDQEAMDELRVIVEARYGGDMTALQRDLQERQQAGFSQVFFVALPLTIVLMILSIALQPYVYLCAAGESKIRRLASRSVRMILPFIGVNFWRFIRSYAWIGLVVMLLGLFSNTQAAIGFVGLGYLIFFILALVHMPRLFFAEIIRLQEPVSAHESVALSWDRTQGYWGKIFGNFLLFGLLMGIFHIGIVIAGMMASLITPYAGPVILFIWIGVIQIAMTLFIFVLGSSILKNPRTTAKIAA